MVRKLDFVTGVTTILIPDLFCHKGQHDHKISQFEKKSLVFDVIVTSGAHTTEWGDLTTCQDGTPVTLTLPVKELTITKLRG